jgi:hypothetical protein
VSCPWDWVYVVPSQQLHLHLVARTPIGLGSLASAAVADWQHMDLSEARGLVLFWVVRDI